MGGWPPPYSEPDPPMSARRKIALITLAVVFVALVVAAFAYDEAHPPPPRPPTPEEVAAKEFKARCELLGGIVVSRAVGASRNYDDCVFPPSKVGDAASGSLERQSNR